MPTKTGNTTTTWAIDTDNQTWTLAKNATITVKNMHGIYESGHNGSTIKVLGDITASGMAYGVYMNGTDSKVFVGADSQIKVKDANGVTTEAAGAEIENHGLIKAGSYGIEGQVWSNVENFGTIRGEDGIHHSGQGSQIYNYGKIDATHYGITELAGGNHIQNGKTGEIIGDVKAIYLAESGAAKIINHGILRGDTAIETEGGIQTVRNAGSIFGDVRLGDDNDIFNSVKGSVNGKVQGGDGDDDYYVGAQPIKIVEQSGSGTGFDEVFAYASHKLAANVEALHLMGSKDINATGNGAANWLYGNGGDNHLNGGGGMDFLSGFGGDDTLHGGGGQDQFVFNRAGVDRVTDFVDGTDLISIYGVNSQMDFDALNIKQLQNGDLQINFGGGDKVIIEDLLKSDFTYNDDIALLP